MTGFPPYYCSARVKITASLHTQTTHFTTKWYSMQKNQEPLKVILATAANANAIWIIRNRHVFWSFPVIFQITIVSDCFVLSLFFLELLNKCPIFTFCGQ